MSCSKRLKICHVASGDLWAGAEVQIFNILSGLKELDKFDLFAVIMNKGRLYEELLRIGIIVKLIDEKKHNFLRQLSLLRAFLRQNAVDLVHTHRYKENIASTLVSFSQRRKLALVKTQHGSILRPSTQRLKRYYLVDRMFTRIFFDKAVGVSADIAKELERSIAPNKIAIIRNSIQPGNYSIATKPTLRKGPFRIGIAGRLVPVKQIDEFIKIAILCKKEGLISDALIAGDGPMLARLKRQAEILGGSRFVRFLGNVANISDFYNAVDIVFITSAHEGLPTVLLEAWYFGKIVIAKPVGGIGEVLKHGENGFLYVRQKEIPTILRLVRQNPKMVLEISKHAYDTVMTEHTHTFQAIRYAELYKESLCRS